MSVNLEGDTSQIRAELAMLRAEVTQLIQIAGQSPQVATTAGGPTATGGKNLYGRNATGGSPTGMTFRRYVAVAHHFAQITDTIARMSGLQDTSTIAGINNALTLDVFSRSLGTAAWLGSVAALAATGFGLPAAIFMLVGGIDQALGWYQLGQTDIRRRGTIMQRNLRLDLNPWEK